MIEDELSDSSVGEESLLESLESSSFLESHSQADLDPAAPEEAPESRPDARSRLIVDELDAQQGSLQPRPAD